MHAEALYVNAGAVYVHVISAGAVGEDDGFYSHEIIVAP